MVLSITQCPKNPRMIASTRTRVNRTVLASLVSGPDGGRDFVRRASRMTKVEVSPLALQFAVKEVKHGSNKLESKALSSERLSVPKPCKGTF